jgi:hypothetical protein
VIGRRGLLAGGAVSVLGRGGLPPRRPDQRHVTLPGTAIGPGSRTHFRRLVVGAAGGPQVIIDSVLNLPVTTQMLATGTAASDVTSISNLQNVIRMPTGAAGETAPCVIGPVKITYTDASVADAILTLSGFFTGATGEFTLLFSSNASALKAGGFLTGKWKLTAGTVVLTPTAFIAPAGGITSYDNTFGGFFATDPNTAGTLIASQEGFHNITGFQNGWLAGGRVVPQRRIVGSPPQDLEVRASFLVPAGFAGGQIVAGPFPAAYQPATLQSGIWGADITTNLGLRFSLGPAGNLIFSGPAANTAAGNTLDVGFILSLTA